MPQEEGFYFIWNEENLSWDKEVYTPPSFTNQVVEIDEETGIVTLRDLD